jgi:oligosaccharide repeat unit polymerase
MMFKSEPPIFTDENNSHYLTNLDIPGRSANGLYLVSLITVGMLSTGFRYIFSGQTDKVPLGMQMGCVFLVLSFWLMRKFLSPKPHNILSPDILFVAFFCVFHFAYMILYTLGIAPWDDEVFWVPGKVLPAVNFCIWSLILFLIGYEIAGNRYSRCPINPVVEPIPPALLPVSKALVILGAAMFFGAILTLGAGRVLSDYEEMLNVGASSPLGRLFWLGQNIGLIGIAMYCAASGINHKKHMVGLFMMVAWIYIISILLLGDRGGFIQLFIIPLMTFHYFQKKIKLSWIVVMVLIVFSGMAIVGLARQSAFGSITAMYREYKATEQAAAYNPVVYSLIEFGTSIKTVVIAMDLVPASYDYWKGKSFVDAMMILVPNIIPGLIRTSQGIVGWLTERAFGQLWATHGRGGSIAMEVYLNFGLYGGVLFFGVLGFVLRCIYERFLMRPNFLRIVFLLGVMAGYALWMRNSSSTFVRPAFWTILVAYIVVLMTRSKTMPASDYSEPQTVEVRE